MLAQQAPGHLASVRSRVFDHLETADVECLALSLEKLTSYLRHTRRAH